MRSKVNSCKVVMEKKAGVHMFRFSGCCALESAMATQGHMHITFTAICSKPAHLNLLTQLASRLRTASSHKSKDFWWWRWMEGGLVTVAQCATCRKSDRKVDWFDTSLDTREPVGGGKNRKIRSANNIDQELLGC